MAKREIKPKISIETHPNGYGLTVDGNAYLYFSPQELLEGIFVHVGLEMGNFMSRETIHDLMIACATWPKEGDAIQAAAQYESQMDALKQQHARDTDTISDLKAKIENLQKQIDKVPDAVARHSAAITKKEPAEKPKRVNLCVTNADRANTNFKPVNEATKAQTIYNSKPKPPTEKKSATIEPRRMPYTELAYQTLLTPIKETDLPTRIMSVMIVVGGRENRSVGEAVQHREAEFVKVRGCGKWVLDHLSEWLTAHDLCLNMDVNYILLEHAKRIIKK